MSLYLMFCSNKQCYVALELSRGKFNVKAAWSYYVPYNFKGGSKTGATTFSITINKMRQHNGTALFMLSVTCEPYMPSVVGS